MYYKKTSFTKLNTVKSVYNDHTCGPQKSEV
jgi:hypothetical protein